MRVPDHSTIAEFGRRHERALAELLTAVLALCREAGLVEVAVVSIDGVKIRANASRGANRSYEMLVAYILKEAEETDRGRTACSVSAGAMSRPSISGPRRDAGPRSRRRRSGWRGRLAAPKSRRWNESSLTLNRWRLAGVGARGSARRTKLGMPPKPVT